MAGLPKENTDLISDKISDLEIKIFGDIEFKLAKVCHTFQSANSSSDDQILEDKLSQSHITPPRNEKQECILAIKMLVLHSFE
ncbi:MAG: hypothetical protein HC860_25975 [Alkalinema sp. RU_4_3]|nr:hypothetical protein [Alkalinema sp. RU_4_3]